VNDEMRMFNYMGDMQMITGEVTGKRQQGAQNLVDVAVRFVNQREEESVRATATIALPQGDRPVIYPEVPRELAEKARQMMRRHWQLSRQ
jgi:hypothetical protein